MAGHSQFKNIMHRKEAQDVKKAKIFSKISREISVAIREAGNDIQNNWKLKSALIRARSENIPKDNIDRVIKKSAGGGEIINYQEIRYEGYAEKGVAIIVEALTNNKNRTASTVRSAFAKFGGHLVESNSVTFKFSHVGYVAYSRGIASDREILEFILNLNVIDYDTSEEYHEVTCSIENLNYIRERLTNAYGEPEQSKIIWKPKEKIVLDSISFQKIEKLIETLEEDDDIQYVFSDAEPEIIPNNL